MCCAGTGQHAHPCVRDQGVKEDCRRKPGSNDDEPPGWIEYSPGKPHRAGEQVRDRQAQGRRSPDQLHAVVEKDDDAESDDDVVEMVAIIKPSEHRKLEQQAKGERREKREYHRQQEASGHEIERDREISAQHVLHAMREIDEVHHAEHKGKAGCDQKQQHSKLQSVEDLNEDESTAHAFSSPAGNGKAQKAREAAAPPGTRHFNSITAKSGA